MTFTHEFSLLTKPSLLTKSQNNLCMNGHHGRSRPDRG
jgi:hypothetical protein